MKITPQNWATTDRYVRVALDVIGIDAFDLDVAASASNRKARNYYSIEEGTDGLSAVWDGWVWCQPPWNNIGPWVEKGIIYSESSCLDGVAFFLPSRTDRPWFHELYNRRNDPRCLLFKFTDHRPAFEDPLGLGRASPKEGCFWAVFRGR